SRCHGRAVRLLRRLGRDPRRRKLSPLAAGPAGDARRRPAPPQPDAHRPGPHRPARRRVHRRGGDSRVTRPGLQPERTDLAWTRTALGAAGAALLLLDVAARRGLTLGALLPAVLTAAVAVTLALLGRRDNGPLTARPVP